MTAQRWIKNDKGEYVPEVIEPTDWVEEKLPFAGATETRLWWLATINNKTYQVEVSGIQPVALMEVWKMEEKFANSVAKVSVPKN